MLHILYSVLELEEIQFGDSGFPRMWIFLQISSVNQIVPSVWNIKWVVQINMSPSSKSHCSWDISEGHSQKMCDLGTINFCKQNVLTEQI